MSNTIPDNEERLPSLTIANSSERKNRHRISEHRAEQRFYKSLRRNGVYNFHVAHKVMRGVPDRYAVGGNWIELKSIPLDRSVSPVRYFSHDQRNFLADIHDRGDRAWACIIFQVDRGEPLWLIKPWHKLLPLGKLTASWIEQHCFPYRTDEDLDAYTAQFFSRVYDRYSDYD